MNSEEAAGAAEVSKTLNFSIVLVQPDGLADPVSICVEDNSPVSDLKTEADKAVGQNITVLFGPVVTRLTESGSLRLKESGLQDGDVLHAFTGAIPQFHIHKVRHSWRPCVRSTCIATFESNLPADKAAWQDVYATGWAFAAVTSDGAVVTFGDSASGGDSSLVASRLGSGVRCIYTTDQAFAALKHDGSVVTWGHRNFGGDSSAVHDLLLAEVQEICSNSAAYAALKQDGSVVAWGDEMAGGNLDKLAENVVFRKIAKLYSDYAGFMAVRGGGWPHGGKTFTWGRWGWAGKNAPYR